MDVIDVLLISGSSRNRGWVLVSAWRRLVWLNCMSHLWITCKTWIFFQASGKLISRNWLINTQGHNFCIAKGKVNYLAANCVTSDTMNLTCYVVSWKVECAAANFSWSWCPLYRFLLVSVWNLPVVLHSVILKEEYSKWLKRKISSDFSKKTWVYFMPN